MFSMGCGADFSCCLICFDLLVLIGQSVFMLCYADKLPRLHSFAAVVPVQDRMIHMHYMWMICCFNIPRVWCFVSESS